MAKVVVVTSGKGGVGKTTSTAALGAALAQTGANVVVVDFDVGLRNLDLVMGAERRVVFDLINVVQGDAKLAQALIRDKRIDTLSLLPASQTRDKDALTSDGVAKVIADLREKFDWVICDSPAGIEKGAVMAMRHADIAVVVTNPEVSSVRDSDRIIGLLDSKTEKAESGGRIEKHLLLTRYDPGPRRARRNAENRRRTRDPFHSPARHHPGKRGGAARIEPRLAGHLAEPAQRARPRLYRCGEAAARRGAGSGGAAGAQGLHRPAVREEGGMNLITLFRRRSSAPVARERLQVLLAHERALTGRSDLLATLQDEILAVIAKHFTIDRDKVQIKLDRGEQVSTLEIDVEVPSLAKMKVAASA